MRCPNPIYLRGDNNTAARTVPCGKCPACIAQKRQQWAFRLQYEEKHSKNAFFVTLTYDDDHIGKSDKNKAYSVSKSDVQLFMKRLRSKCNGKIKYYAVSEYGTMGHRPHYHIILFNVFPSTSRDVYQLVSECWGQGFVDVGTVTPASINYVTKYVFKKTQVPPECEKPFALMSRRPGIGFGYVDTHRAFHLADNTRFYGTLLGGVKVSLPRYFQEKIYPKIIRDIRAAKLKDLPTNIDKLELDPNVHENAHTLAQLQTAVKLNHIQKSFTDGDKF